MTTLKCSKSFVNLVMQLLIHMWRPNLEMNPHRRFPGAKRSRSSSFHRPQSIGAGVKTSAANASAGVRKTLADCQSGRVGPLPLVSRCLVRWTRASVAKSHSQRPSTPVERRVWAPIYYTNHCACNVYEKRELVATHVGRGIGARAYHIFVRLFPERVQLIWTRSLASRLQVAYEIWPGRVHWFHLSKHVGQLKSSQGCVGEVCIINFLCRSMLLIFTLWSLENK